MKTHGIIVEDGKIYISDNFPQYDFVGAVESALRVMDVYTPKAIELKFDHQDDFLESVFADLLGKERFVMRVAVFDRDFHNQFIYVTENSKVSDFAISLYGKYLVSSAILYGLKQAFSIKMRQKNA